VRVGNGCGLVGCGTVGGGVVRLWSEPGHAPGARLAAVAVRDVRKPRTADLGGMALTADPWRVVRDPRIGLVVEATGDAGLGRDLAVECFRRGKSFVTAGKELVARCGPELESLAGSAGVAFRYEAAAGGALPLVALLRLGLSPGGVRGFEGVLNGTCNFILSRLDRGLRFAAALDRAREQGFAEADSGRDTSGRDTAEKLVILARLCGVRLEPGALEVRGIEGLGPEDAAFARRRGWSLRLLACFHDGDPVVASVGPALVPRASLLAQARDEENAVLLDAGPAGTLGIVGRGAGALPTASAILADVREVLRGGHLRHPPAPRAPPRIAAEAPGTSRHYVRLEGRGEPGPDLVRALDAAGVALDVLSSPRRGCVQAVTASAPTAIVRRVVAAVPSTESHVIPVRDEQPAVARPSFGSSPADARDSHRYQPDSLPGVIAQSR